MSGAGVSPERFRQALATWASGVSVVAVREEAGVLATTVSAFLSVSVEPPLVLISLGPSAQVLPFLTEGRRFAVSVLREDQRRIASDFADPYPVGPSPFPASGSPTIADALVSLDCVVERIDPAGDHELVLARVDAASVAGGAPLVRWSRGYHGLREL